MTYDIDKDVEKVMMAALEHMPAITEKKCTAYTDGTVKEELEYCPPFEFIKQYLRPALKAALTNSNAVKELKEAQEEIKRLRGLLPVNAEFFADSDKLPDLPPKRRPWGSRPRQG